MIVKSLHLPVHSDQSFRVGVAGGRTLKVDRTCRNLQWSMMRTTFEDDFILLDVGQFDMIMGAQWLRRLGKILLDMDQLSMAFYHQGHHYELQGMDASRNDPFEASIGSQDLSLAQHVFLVQEATESLLQVCQKAELTSLQQSDLTTLLTSFSDVFAEPTSLPPQRAFDHHIPLQSGRPVSCCLYRYEPMQKSEIEHQVQQMLETGVIRPSQSPFTVPIVLVHKKDGSWRFCIDYRKLNEETVKNKFPIPLIEDLLNELHGASFFSKLDLRAGYHQIRMHPPTVTRRHFALMRAFTNLSSCPSG